MSSTRAYLEDTQGWSPRALLRYVLRSAFTQLDRLKEFKVQCCHLQQNRCSGLHPVCLAMGFKLDFIVTSFSLSLLHPLPR